MKRKKIISSLAGQEPNYRKPPYQDLSSLVAGRMQAGPHASPPRSGPELEEWQDLELFHSPEL